MTESEIVERVARAMCVATDRNPDATSINEHGWFCHEWHTEMRLAQKIVAAIAAYREVTGE